MTHEPITNDDQLKRESILHGVIKQLLKEASASTLGNLLYTQKEKETLLPLFPDIEDKINDYIAWELRERHKRIGHIKG